jgi:hypothetical protein
MRIGHTYYPQGHEYNEKVFHVYAPFILHGVLVHFGPSKGEPLDCPLPETLA